MSKDSSRTVSSSLGRLNISNDRPSSKSQKAPVADSWEDEADGSSDNEVEDDGASTPRRPGTSDMPDAPPPTPSSPSASMRDTNIDYPLFSSIEPGGAFNNPGRDERARRPDKTTSVASRLIAAGIGQKAPKRTQEQREYDQAMKIQEKKKRDQAREEEERKKREKEQAQKDIWGD